MQRYLGMVNFYHRFLPGIARILALLHSLVTAAKSAKSPLLWQEESDQAFKEIREHLLSPAMLAHPTTGISLYLTTNASDSAIGAVLPQGPHCCPLGFFSMKLSPTQTKYSAFHRELLAIKEAIQHFRHESWSFTVFTDHKPLTFIMATTTPKTPRQERHLGVLQFFRHRGCKDSENFMVANFPTQP